MYEALIKGTNKLITIDTFKRQYGEKAVRDGLELICPACRNIVHPYALVSFRRKACFHHNPNTSCIYLDERDSYIAIPKQWDIESGKRLRASLGDKEFISKLYCFCLTLCRRGNLPVDKFIGLVKKADKRNLWSHAGLEEWIIGFVLLVLDDFEAEDKSGRPYVFRFLLEQNFTKPNPLITKSKQKVDIEDLTQQGDYFLVKVFDNGNLMRHPEGNPYLVSKDSWKKFSKEYEWAYKNQGDRLLKRVKELKE